MQELKRECNNLNTAQLICDEIGDQLNRLRYRRDIKSVLVYQGYSFTPGDEIYVPKSLQSSLQCLLSESVTLPKDKYCPEQTRYRRHSRLIFLPWENNLIAWPKNSYFQDSQINVDDGGVVREFEPLSAVMLDNVFLQELIFADFKQTSFQAPDLLQPFDVGIHVIKTVPGPEQAAVASPNRLHKDTEPFTFIHLLARENVTGGENIVADNTKEPLFIGTLTSTLDTLVVQDATVFHHVMPIKLADQRLPGFRTVLLIDFTPLKSAVNQY
jgi:hypothetical protein